MQLEDNWTSGGINKTVTTTQTEGEELKKFFARHDEAVTLRKKQCPPD